MDDDVRPQRKERKCCTQDTFCTLRSLCVVEGVGLPEDIQLKFSYIADTKMRSNPNVLYFKMEGSLTGNILSLPSDWPHKVNKGGA